MKLNETIHGEFLHILSLHHQVDMFEKIYSLPNEFCRSIIFYSRIANPKVSDFVHLEDRLFLEFFLKKLKKKTRFMRLHSFFPKEFTRKKCFKKWVHLKLDNRRKN